MFKRKEKFFGFTLGKYWRVFKKEMKKDNGSNINTVSFVIRDNKLLIDEEHHNKKDYVGRVYGINLFVEGNE